MWPTQYLCEHFRDFHYLIILNRLCTHVQWSEGHFLSTGLPNKGFQWREIEQRDYLSILQAKWDVTKTWWQRLTQDLPRILPTSVKSSTATTSSFSAELLHMRQLQSIGVPALWWFRWSIQYSIQSICFSYSVALLRMMEWLQWRIS